MRALTLTAALLATSAAASSVETTAIPPAREVVTKLDAGNLDDIRRRELAVIYDDARARLMAAEIDPRVTIAILSSFLRGSIDDMMSMPSLSAFDLHARRYTLNDQRCMADRLSSVAKDFGEKWKLTRRANLIPDDIADTPELYVQGKAAVAYQLMMTVSFNSRDVAATCNMIVKRAPIFLPRWREPIRINSTGNAYLDQQITRSLVTLKKRVPQLPIDANTFPAAPSGTNFWVGSADQRRVRDMLAYCRQGRRCETLGDLFKKQHGLRTTTTTSIYFNTYLSSPYYAFGNGPTNTLVALGENATIREAACGSADMTFVPANMPSGPTVTDPDGVLLCLARGLGASPDTITDVLAKKRSRADVALAQLAELYS